VHEFRHADRVESLELQTDVLAVDQQRDGKLAAEEPMALLFTCYRP
jgi:hypothetical protein